MRSIGLAIGVVLLLSGCMHTKLHNPNAQPGEVKEYQTSHYMGGFGESVVNVQCPNGIQKLEHGATFGNGVMQSLTLSIWCPRTVRVTCAASPDASH